MAISSINIKTCPQQGRTILLSRLYAVYINVSEMTSSLH